MAKYIDAEKLKELIDEKWKELANKNVKVGGGKWDAEISTYLSILRLIDSLQQELPEADLEKAARYVYESWMGGTMNDVRRDIIELGKVLNARKEK